MVRRAALGLVVVMLGCAPPTDLEVDGGADARPTTDSALIERLTRLAPHDDARASRSVHVTLPAQSSEPFVVEDARSGVRIGVTLAGARATSGATSGAFTVFSHALARGDGAVALRVDHDAIEDFVALPERPANESLTYDVDVTGVAGVRFVDGVVELLDPSGAPRLRMNRPYVLDPSDVRHAASVSVEGCAFDTSVAPPWGRPPTPPASARCRIVVAWSGVAYPAIVDPIWGATGSFITARSAYTQTLLATGKVLVTGGFDASNLALASSELFDSATGTFAATGAMAIKRTYHTGTLLQSGKVLVVGGGSTMSAELYDTSTGAFTAAGVPKQSHSNHSAIVLASGKVLIASGSFSTSAEIYSPSTNTFAVTGSLTTARQDQTAALLANGKVLVAGGWTTNGVDLASAELFDPAANAGVGAFAAVGSMSTPRSDFSAILLTSGKVLAAGGWNSITGYQSASELFDPNTNQFSATGALKDLVARYGATRMPDGRVLIVGGTGTQYYDRTEYYDPNAGTFSFGPLMTIARSTAIATLLPSNKVFVTGGPSATSEVLGGALGDACTTDAYCISNHCADGRCCNTACNGGGCDRCDLPTQEGTCTIAPSGNPGANPVCATPFACDGASAVCPSTCASDAACAAGFYCGPSGTCVAQKAKSASCHPSTDCKLPPCRECVTGFCVDSFCCDTACSGGCSSCAAALKQSGSDDGACGPTKDGTDPRVECEPSGVLCGADGLCNGTGGCRLFAPAGLSCSNDGKVCDGQGVCDLPKASTCDGDHTTTGIGGVKIDCAPYKCKGDGKCLAKCDSVSDCVAPFVCTPAGVCVNESDGAGGCSTSSNGDGAAPWPLLLVGMLILSRARKTGRGTS